MPKSPLCLNYSIENKQCRFNYDQPQLLNFKDINPLCDGYKSSVECCWYRAYLRDFP